MTNTNVQHPDCLFMIEQAVKAPSGHNTQPWLFKISEDNIQIHPNYDKSLPVVDPDNRELFISLGCAAENLCIAASQKGYNTDLNISEEGIVTIHLKKDHTVEPNTLFDQIAIRQTNRSVYNGQIISSDTIRLLERVFEASVANAYFYKNGTPEFNSIADYVIAGNVLQMQNKAFTDELKSWMRFNKKHQDTTNDGLSYAVFGAPNLPRFIVKPIMSSYLNDKTQNKGDRKKIASSSHFALLTVTGNTPEEWIRLGMVMERFLLKTTELGITHAYMNQPNEVNELSGEMTETLNIFGEYPAILLRIGYGEKMPYSKRKDIEEVIISE
ncbi:MAG: nitroreductase [Tannerella sp.]|jgi:hypothetical protein|nr:nitroreductase [Tannerella sp.]